MSLICQLSLHTDSVSQFEDLLLSVIDQIPFPPETNCNDAVISSLICMCKEKEKFAFLYKPILFIFAQIAVMSISERKPLKILPENLNEVKNVIKIAVRADPSLERELTKDFTRQKQNLFKSLVK